VEKCDCARLGVVTIGRGMVMTCAGVVTLLLHVGAQDRRSRRLRSEAGSLQLAIAAVLDLRAGL
jgi:hypothetical protein